MKYVGGGQYEQPETSQYLSLLTPSHQLQDQIQLRGELTLRRREGSKEESTEPGRGVTWKKCFNDVIAPASAKAEEYVQKRPE